LQKHAELFLIEGRVTYWRGADRAAEKVNLEQNEGNSRSAAATNVRSTLYLYEEYGHFRGRSIRRASRMTPVCRKSRMHLETRGFPVLSAAAIKSYVKWRRCNWIIWASRDVDIARNGNDGIFITGRQIIF
jgi:hypothetical protein